VKLKPGARPLPPTRLFTIDTCAIAKDKHYIGALLELDVTEGRRRLRRLRAAGASGSFLGWVLKCLSQALREYPEVCALLLPRRRILLFPTIDLNVLVERDIEGQRVPLPVVIRDAGAKSIAQISEELRRAQLQTVSGQIVLGAGRARRSERLYGLLPAWLRRWILRRVIRNPASYRGRLAPVSVTSVGMFGKVNGWFLPLGMTPLVVGLGAVTRKPWALGDQIQLRDILHLSLLLDHDVVDGAPMARFVARLAWLLVQAWGLETAPAQAGP
jgi:pyruvate/2-oxoglutarate dehydrogenase complex dihydrolipoamide acyltransferase (E2) component